jgi:YidC/Oxa1 family membrane protein insertase
MSQQQQPRDNASRLRPFLVLYLVFLGFLGYQQFFAPKPPQAPAQAASQLAQAWGKEHSVRTVVLERNRKRLEDLKANPAPEAAREAAELEETVRQQEAALAGYTAAFGEAPKTEAGPMPTEADLKKRLEEAIHLYEDFYQKNRNAADPQLVAQARQARFQEINVYDFLAVGLEGRRSGAHWHDQAQPRLKEMEKDFLGKQGAVAMEVDGKFIPAGEPQDLGRLAETRLNQMRLARDERKRDSITYRIPAFFVGLFGGRSNPYSYFLALLTIVVILKGATWPLQKKQYQYQRDMMRIQPLLKEVQEKYKGRPPEEMQKRIFQIYKENNVNLAGGCLPMLVLAVVLLPVYWMVLDYEYQFTYGQFLWIGSAFSEKVWWLADNLAQFDVPLFVVYLASTVVYSLMQPKPVDPQQAQQQKMMLIMMPIMFGFFMWIYKWSSAFMLYWLVLNLVSMYQSWRLNTIFGLLKPAVASTVSEGEETPTAKPVPAAPLEPMKGVQTKSQGNGKNGRRGTPGRIRPKGSGHKG